MYCRLVFKDYAFHFIIFTFNFYRKKAITEILSKLNKTCLLHCLPPSVTHIYLTNNFEQIKDIATVK